MISDCSYCGILGLDEKAFFQDAFALLLLVLPAAICFTLWRMFVTNKTGHRGGVVVLGLDDSSPTNSDPSQSGISVYLRLSCCTTSILTFAIGLASSEAFKFLRKLFYRMFV
jgi:hypothetical protein